MPSTYSPNLRIELIATGEQSGTWGITTNTNLGTLIEDAVAGYVAVTVTSANQALTALNGAADQSRNMTIALSTTTSAAFNVYIPPAEKFYVIRNLSAYDATIFCSTVLGNTTAAGAGVRIAGGTTFQVCTDGTDVYEAVNSFAGSLTINGNSTLGSPRLSATYAQTGTTLVTVTTSTAHGYTTGNVIQFIPTSGNSNGGSYTITVLGPTTFTFTNTARTTSGNALVTNDTVTLNGVVQPGVVISSNTGTTYPALRITQNGTGDALLVEDDTNPDSTPFVIDTNGRVIDGFTGALGTYVDFGGATVRTPQIQLQGASLSTAGLSATNWAAANSPPVIYLAKSRSGTVGTQGSPGSTLSGDALGVIQFNGDDGTNFVAGAAIFGYADGTTGAGDMPGRLVFSTTADGSTSPTERLRIDSEGRVDMRSSMTETGNSSASTISGTTLTIGGTVSGTFNVGDRIFGVNVEPNTFITALGTGTGGAGTYTVSNSQTAASAAIRAIGGGINVFRFTDTDTGVLDAQPMGVIEWFGSDSSTPGAGVKAYIAGISENASPDTALIFGTSDNVASTQAVERMRIDSIGKLLVNANTAYATVAVNSAITPQIQVSGTSISTSSVAQFAWDTSPYYTFNRSNGGVGVYTAVSSGDTLGNIQFNGSDGNGFFPAALIRGGVDAAVSTGIVPGNLQFFTESAAGAIEERMRITSGGLVGIGRIPDATYQLDVANPSTASGQNSFLRVKSLSTSGDGDAEVIVDAGGTGEATFRLRENGINRGYFFAQGGEDYIQITNPIADADLYLLGAGTSANDTFSLRYARTTGSAVVTGVTGTITSSANTSTITGLSTTTGLTIGDVLTKTAGTGVLGTQACIVSIDSATQITVRNGFAAMTAGSITFTARPSPTTITAYSTTGASNWTVNQDFARFAFGNGDTSGAGDGGIKASINAYMYDADGTGAGLDFYVSSNGTTLKKGVRLDQNADLQFNSGYGSVATAYGCRAWVNFNGTGTVTIRDSGNVSSVVDNSTGNYTVNFSNAMPDANFNAVSSMASSDGTGGVRFNSTGARTTTTVKMYMTSDNRSGSDALFADCAIFR